MAKRDDTTKRRSGRTRIKKVASAAPKPSISTDYLNALLLPSSPDPLKHAIDKERTQLMRAHAVVKTLSAALMQAEDDDAMFYVDTANVAADLIDEAVERLNGIGMGKGVKEPFVEYVCFDRIFGVCSRPVLSPRGAAEGTGKAGGIGIGSMWLDEVQRRSAELDAGLVTPIPAEDVFERAHTRLKQ